MKQIAAVIAAAALFAAPCLTGCASTNGPQPATSTEPAQGTFQGTYTGNPAPAKEVPVDGTFQGSYTGHPNPADEKKVTTTNKAPKEGD
jgi:hypothetical protein